MAKSGGLFGGSDGPNYNEFFAQLKAEEMHKEMIKSNVALYAEILDELYDVKPKTRDELPKAEVKMITGKVKHLPDPDVNWGFSTIGDSLYD